MPATNSIKNKEGKPPSNAERAAGLQQNAVLRHAAE